MDMEEAIDTLLDSFVYVREIGRGGDNHIGIELTVKSCHKTPDDLESRKSIKQFLLDSYKPKEI